MIFSYIFREAHDAFLKQTDSSLAPQNPNEARLIQESYSIGAVVGICFAGVIADLFLKKKRFLIILVLNILLLFWDFYLFFRSKTATRDPITHVDPFFVGLGAILASNDLIYLILIPMLIAKNHSEKMAQNFRFQRICYAGTIAGVVLALCTVGKYLFSTNLASFLDFLSTPKG